MADDGDNAITIRENGNTEYDVEVITQTTEYVVSSSNATTTEEYFTTLNVEELPEDGGFKTRFFEAQDRLGELEGELKCTRERLRNLEDACENTEEKIGVLKNAAFSYHRQFNEHERSYKTVLEENRILKITIQKLETTIRIYKKGVEESEEVRNNNADLKDQLDAARKDKDELITQLDDLRDLTAQHDSNKECERCAQRDDDDDDLRRQMESLKLKYDEIDSEKHTLQRDKDKLSYEVHDLEIKLQELQIKLSADDEVIEEMKGQIADYHVQVNDSEDNCNKIRARNFELEKEMSILKGRLAELEISYNSEKDSKEELIREGTKRLEVQYKRISQLEMNLKEISKEKELLYLQFVDSKNKAEMDAKQATQQLNEAHVRAELFKKEVADKEKILITLRAENEELKGLKDDLAALKQQLQDAQDRYLSHFGAKGDGDSDDADGEASTDEDEEGADELKKENEELRLEVAQLRDEVFALQTELATKVQESEKDGGPVTVTVLEGAPLAPTEEDLSDFEEERIVVVGETLTLSAMPIPRESEDSWSDQDYFKNQIQELDEVLERTRREKQRVEESLVESEEKSKRTIDELSTTISHLNERCEEMRKELIEKEIIINRMRNEESLNQNQIRDLEEKLRERQHFEEELEKARRELQALKSSAREDDFYKRKYEKVREEHDKCFKDIKELKEENEELAKQKAELENEIEAMNQKFEAGKKMYGEVCDENDERKKEIVKLEEEIKFLHEELKEEEDLHRTERDDLKAKNKDLEEKLRELQNKKKDLEEKLRELEAKLADLNAKLKGKEDETNWKDKHDGEKREKLTLEREKQRLERNLQKTEDEHEDTKSKYGSVRRELSDVRGENTKLVQQHSDVKRAKDTADRELSRLKESLRKKEEECKRHLKELEELKRRIQRHESSDDGWQVKFESLKLKFDEVEDEKDSLQKEKNNLQNELRRDSEKLAEVEIKLSQAKAEKDGLSHDFQKSHTKITTLEIELQRCAKQRQQAEEEAKWIKKELITREETITRLGLELNDKRNNEDVEGEKDVRIVVLEREIQLLHSRIPTSDKDEAMLGNQIRILEDNIKTIKEQLDGKTVQLDDCGKENERLSIHVVELSKEIQSLYRRYEASQAQVVALQAAPPVPDKVETTSLTIDVEQPDSEVQLGIHVQERVRSRVVTPGLARSTCAIDVPMSLVPGTVVIGEPVGVKVDYNMMEGPLVTHSAEVTASEPEDNDDEHSSEESEDISPVFVSQVVESAPPPSYQPSVNKDPERILISAQAIPVPQVPRSIDPGRYPFIKGSGVRLNPGAFQPIPFRSREDPFDVEPEPEEQSAPTAVGRFRAYSEEDLKRLDGLLHEPHPHEPPENGLDYSDRYQPAEPYYEEVWSEPYLQPQDAHFAETAPDGKYDVYPQPPSWERPEADPSHREEYPDPYEAPPRKPESSYTRRIMGVYDDDGNLIGYQEVYEEKTDGDPTNMDGRDWDRSNVRELRDGSVEAVPYRSEPPPYATERYPPENVPYMNGARQPRDRDEGPPYSIQRYDHDGPINDRYIDNNNEQPYITVKGRVVGEDEQRRVKPLPLAKQYARGSYL